MTKLFIAIAFIFSIVPSLFEPKIEMSLSYADTSLSPEEAVTITLKHMGGRCELHLVSRPQESEGAAASPAAGKTVVIEEAVFARIEEKVKTLFSAASAEKVEISKTEATYRLKYETGSGIRERSAFNPLLDDGEGELSLFREISLEFIQAAGIEPPSIQLVELELGC